MKLIVNSSQLTESQLAPELEATKTSIKEQLIPMDKNLNLPSSFEVCEFNDPWDLSKDLRFFHHLELECHIKIRNQEVLMVCKTSPLLVALELSGPTNEYFEATIGTLKKPIDEDALRRFNSEETSTRKFEFKITYKNLSILSEGIILKPRIWEDDCIKFYDSSFGLQPLPSNQQGIRRSSNTPRIYTQTQSENEDNEPPRMSPPARHIRRSSRDRNPVNLGESYVPHPRSGPRNNYGFNSYSPSYHRRRTPSPRHSSPRPRHERTTPPRNSPIHRRSPTSQRSPSPRRRSPPHRRSPTPPRRSATRRRSPSPPQRSTTRRRSPTPPRRSPTRRRSPTPPRRSLTRRRSPSPRRRSITPIRSPSPRRRSPTRQRSHSTPQRNQHHQHSPPPRRHSPIRSPTTRRSPPRVNRSITPPASFQLNSSSSSTSSGSRAPSPGRHQATTSIIRPRSQSPRRTPNQSNNLPDVTRNSLRSNQSSRSDNRSGHNSDVLNSIRDMRISRSGIFSPPKGARPKQRPPGELRAPRHSTSSSSSPGEKNQPAARTSRQNPTTLNAAAESEQTIDQTRNLHHQVSGINAQYKELRSKATAPNEHESVYLTTVEPAPETQQALGNTTTIPEIVTVPDAPTNQLPSTVSSTRSHLSPSMNEIEINESGIQRLNISEAPSIPPPPPPVTQQTTETEKDSQPRDTAEKNTNTSLPITEPGDIDLANDSLTNKVINRSRQGRTNPFASTDSDTDENEVYLNDANSPLDERLEGVIQLLRGREDDVRHGLGLAKDWYANNLFEINTIGRNELMARLDNMAKLLVQLTVIISRKDRLSESTVEEAAQLGKEIFTTWSKYETSTGRVYTRARKTSYNQNVEAFSNVGWDHPTKSNDTPDTLDMSTAKAKGN